MSAVVMMRVSMPRSSAERPLRIALAVEPLVMRAGDPGESREGGDAGQDLLAERRVAA